MASLIGILIGIASSAIGLKICAITPGIKKLTLCLKCRKNAESTNPKVARTKNGRIMLLSKRAVCDSKKIEIYQTARS